MTKQVRADDENKAPDRDKQEWVEPKVSRFRAGEAEVGDLANPDAGINS